MLARVRFGAGLAVVAAVTVLISGGTVVAQQDVAPPVSASASASASASEALAKQLAETLGAAQLDSIAAKDSQGADRFVAALYFPGRLLVVSARNEGTFPYTGKQNSFIYQIGQRLFNSDKADIIYFHQLMLSFQFVTNLQLSRSNPVD